jgi:hypothetical protein
VPLCPPQNPHTARTRTWAAAVGSQRLTAWAKARPANILKYSGGLRSGPPRFDSRQRKFFLFSTGSRPALGPTHPRIKWVPVASKGVKRQGCEADHSPPPSVEVKSSGTIPPLPHMSWLFFWTMRL